MSRLVEQPLSVLDIIKAIFKYRWRTMATFLLLLAIGVAGLFLFPKKYESEAKLFVRLGRGSVAMDPAATTGPTISLQESRETEMNSVVDLLQSRQLVELIVNKVSVERILEKHSPAEKWIEQAVAMIPKIPGGGSPGDMTEEEVEAQADLEEAIKYLQGNIRVSSPKKSTTVGITCRARTPKLAQDVAQAMLQEYQKLHLNAYQSQGSFDFFTSSFDEQEDLVMEYEHEMRTAKNEMAMITVGGKQDSLQQQITSVQRDIMSTEADLAAAGARVADLTEDMDALPKEIPAETTSGIANAASDSMRAQLYELEIREKELLSKYKKKHPVLAKLQQQLRDARKVLEDQKGDREHNTMAPNPVRRDTHVLLLTEKSRVAALDSKLEALHETETTLVEKAKQVNAFEVKAAELQRKIDIAKANHAVYAQKLQESRINAALDSEAISNVSIVQPPTFTMKHVSPKRSVLGLLAFVFSVMGATLVAVVSDRFSRGPLDDRDLLLIQAKERLLRLEAADRDARIAEHEAKMAERIALAVKEEVSASAPLNPQLPR